MAGHGAGMSKFQRVQQWLVFARQWHLIDGNFQDPIYLAQKVARHLIGAHKPIFHPETECGDHVVVYNTKLVAMKGFDWKRRDYYFDRRYPRSKHRIPAWEIHQFDPARILWLEVYRALPKIPWRSMYCERLHLFPDENIPEEILENVGSQLRQIQRVPKAFDQYSDEEKKAFPSLYDWPEGMTVDDSFGKIS